jgi:hypothetical protein
VVGSVVTLGENNWSVSDVFLGEFWLNPGLAVKTFRAVFATIAPFIDVKFNHVGFFSRPTAAIARAAAAAARNGGTVSV